MEWLWIVVAAGGAGFAARWWRARQATQHARAEELHAVRRLAEEDSAYLDERVQHLAREVEARAPDEESRADLQAALSSSEAARHALAEVSRAEDVSEITSAVSTGRHAVALGEARLAGSPAPEKRVMCFFDPLHGPSVVDVLWNRPGHGGRPVPVCAPDAERLAQGQAPDIRMVQIGTRRMPYWAAGGAFLPYTQGYFAGVAALSWAVHPSVSDAAAGSGAAGAFGTGIVGSSGHFDGGGFDGSGAGQ